MKTGGIVSLGGVALGYFWLRRSSSFPARFLRERMAEACRTILPSPAKPDPGRWGDGRVTAAWLGHSTVLLNLYGIRILTDPVFFSRVGIDMGLGVLGPKRMVAPALLPSELPPVDVVLLSHAHMDHMDLPSLQSLAGSPVMITAKATSDLLTSFRRVVELSWGESTTVRCAAGELRIESFEVKHWGARIKKDMHRGYNGYILRREGMAILFGGDTAYTPLFERLKGPFELGIMPIGAYRPWIRNHCTPEEAIRMADAAGVRRILPVHHATFVMSDEPMFEPIERFETAMEQEKDRMALRQIGETCRVA